MEKIAPDVVRAIEAFNEFAPGVPATDKLCAALLEVLEAQWKQTRDGVDTPWVHSKEAKDDYALVFQITDDYCFKIGKRETEDGECAIEVTFYYKHTLSQAPSIPQTFYPKRALLQVPPLIRGDFAPDGLREVLARTKAYTKDLRERGVCPKCPGDNKNLRCPSADFCEICCFKEALGLRGKPPR